MRQWHEPVELPAIRPNMFKNMLTTEGSPVPTEGSPDRKQHVSRYNAVTGNRVSSFGGLIEFVSERINKDHAVRARTKYLAAMRRDTDGTKLVVSMCLVSSGS